MRQLGLIIGFSIAMIATRPAAAGDCGCCEVTCPSCDHVCELKQEDASDKKHCWKIEYKPICIPKVTFPWQRGCCDSKSGKGGKGGCITPQNGAKMKYVKVLVKHEYKCERCKYKFTPVPCGKGDGKGEFYKPAPGQDSPIDIPADPPEVRNVPGMPTTPVVQYQGVDALLAR